MKKPKLDQEPQDNVLYIRGDRDLKRALRRLLKQEQSRQPGVVLSMSSVCRRLLWEGIFRSAKGYEAAQQFQITQKFNETFDPDRVAEALVEEMLKGDLDKSS